MFEKAFVGREHQMKQLSNFLDLALVGKTQCCFVVGGAGSGKSALVQQFISRTQEAISNLVLQR